MVGEVVRVTPVAGRQVIGRTIGITGGTLEVSLAPRNRTFALGEIITLERRVTIDSDLGQGALSGAGVGLVAHPT